MYSRYGVYKIANAHGDSIRSAVASVSGHCTTGDSLDHCKEDDEIMAANEATAKDMEFAALSCVAELFETPIIGVKVVTDLVDGDRPSHEEFMENLGMAAKSLQENVEKIIDSLCGEKA